MTFPDATNPWGIKELGFDELVENYQDLPEDLVALGGLATVALNKTGEQLSWD